MTLNHLSKNTTNSKTMTNENIIKDSFISEKIIFNVDDDNTQKMKIDNSFSETEVDMQSIMTEYNEFSVFNSIEENQLKLNDDDKKIYYYLIKNYRTEENIEEFMNYFYPEGYKNTPEMKAVDFYLVGVFEDLMYYPVWMSDESLVNTMQEFREKFDIYYWRRIKGDGNCYYRSVLINYIEILITNSIRNDDYSIFFGFIKEILFTKFPKEIYRFKKTLLTVLLLIYEHAEKKSSFSYDILYRSVHKSQCIEKCLIYWFKIKISEFLKQNINLEINGLKLLQAIPEINYDDEDKKIILPDNKELNEYIDNKILKMDEYVEGYPIYITPFILKCSINIYSLNKSISKVKHNKNKNSNKNNYVIKINKEKIELPKDTMYIPVVEYLPNLNEDEINILFRSPHYDSLSIRKFVNNVVDIYLNPDIILVEGLLTKNEYEKYKTLIVENWNIKNKLQKRKKSKHKTAKSSQEGVKKSLIAIENEIKTNKEHKSDDNNINFDIKTEIKDYKILDKFKNTNISINSGSSRTSSMQIKYIECLTKCSLCTENMNHRLPCGCLICNECSKKKIQCFHEDNNNIKIPLSVCSCGYILNDKDQKIIVNNKYI